MRTRTQLPASPSSRYAEDGGVRRPRAAHPLLGLQRSIGNRAVAQMVRRSIDPPAVQRTLNGGLKSKAALKAKYGEVLAAVEKLDASDGKAFDAMLASPADYKVVKPEQLSEVLQEFRLDHVARVYGRSRYFHASQRANWESILKTGLDPAQGGNKTGASALLSDEGAEEEYFRERSRGTVHLSVDAKTVETDYANKLTEASLGGSVARVFLTREELSRLAIDLNQMPDARKLTTLIPASRIRPRRGSIEALAPKGHLADSKTAVTTAILSHDVEQVIPPAQFETLAQKAHQTRRMSFGGFADAKTDAGSTPVATPADVKATKDSRLEFSDVEHNAAPIRDADLKDVVDSALGATHSKLALEALNTLATHPVLKEWLVKHLTEDQRAKLVEAAGDKKYAADLKTLLVISFTGDLPSSDD